MMMMIFASWHALGNSRQCLPCISQLVIGLIAVLPSLFTVPKSPSSSSHCIYSVGIIGKSFANTEQSLEILANVVKETETETERERERERERDGDMSSHMCLH